MKVSQEAWNFVERYSNGGKMCTDCKNSYDAGLGHICKISHGTPSDQKQLDPTDCPALPDELYPEPVLVWHIEPDNLVPNKV